MATRVIGDYAVGMGIGYGRSRPRTQVKIGHHVETGEAVALKLVDRTELTARQLGSLEKEAEAMGKLSHPHIIGLRDVVWDADYPKKDGSSSRHVVCLVLELAPGGELFDFMFRTQRGFPEDFARAYFRQLIAALQHMHKAGLAHRDLKTENLVLDEHFNLKVTDMGFATALADADGDGAEKLLKTQCGTFGYMAPEVLAGHKYRGSAVDVWGAGVILFTMLAGFPPFIIQKKAHDSVATAVANDWWFQRIINNQHSYFWDAHMRKAAFSDDAIALMNKIFVADPSRRATIDDIIADPWFSKEDAVPADVLEVDMMRRKDKIDREKAAEKERMRKEREARRAAMAAATTTFSTFGGGFGGVLPAGMAGGGAAVFGAGDAGGGRVIGEGSATMEAPPSAASGVAAGSSEGPVAAVYDSAMEDRLRMRTLSSGSPTGSTDIGSASPTLARAASAPGASDKVSEGKTATTAPAAVLPLAPADGAAGTSKRYSQIVVDATGTEVMERLAQTFSRMCAEYKSDDDTFKVKATVQKPGGEVKLAVRLMRVVGADDAGSGGSGSERVLVDVRRKSGLVSFYEVFDRIAEDMADITWFGPGGGDDGDDSGAPSAVEA